MNRGIHPNCSVYEDILQEACYFLDHIILILASKGESARLRNEVFVDSDILSGLLTVARFFDATEWGLRRGRISSIHSDHAGF